MLIPKLLVLVSACCLCLFPTASESSSSSCTTPDHQRGECKPIRQCSVFHDLLKILTNETISFLRNARCDRTPNDKSNPEVCCPSKAPHFPPKNSTIGGTESTLLPPRNECRYFSEKFIGNEVALLGFFPWTVLLKYQIGNKAEFYCGGTIINDQYVLTAAHCFSKEYLPQNATLISVLIGEYNLNTDPDCQSSVCSEPVLEIPIEETIVHEKFNYSSYQKSISENDIALVRLEEKIAFNDFVKPACLPAYSERISTNYDGVTLWRGGWGIDNHNVSNFEKIRNEVLGKNLNDCKKLLNLTLTENQFCVGKAQNYQRCSSDSGGAVSFYDYDTGHYVAGVEAWHSQCGENQVAVYTKVSQYVKWIVKNLRQ